MKIRAGFVSNSSSSSFVLFGAVMSKSDFVYSLVEQGHLPTTTNLYDIDVDYDLREIWNKTNLSFASPSGWGQVYIGVDPSSFRDNETGKEFRQRVSAEIEELTGKKFECELYSESWYD